MSEMLIHEFGADDYALVLRFGGRNKASFEWSSLENRKGIHNYSTPPIREEEIQAIRRGVEQNSKKSHHEFDLFYRSNRNLVVLGMGVVCALLAGIWCYKNGTSPFFYGLPIILAFMYTLLILISEVRLSKAARK